LPSLVLLPSVSKLGVVVPERAPNSVALLPRLVSSPERGSIVAKHVPSGVASSPRGMALLPERGVVIIVAAIDDNDGATAKQCLVGVGSASRGDSNSKREQIPPGRQ
jgi:hypothetical protein